jgi:MFS family permease
LWLVFGREGPLDNAPVKEKHAAQSTRRVGYAQLLLSPTILACWAASFGANWGLSLALSWQGAYLIKGLGLTQSSIGFLGALAPGGSAVAMLAAGWYSQRLLSRGVSSRVARGILGGLSVMLGGVALAMLPYVPGTPVKIALTTLGVALPSAIYVISNAVVGEITPAAQRGALLAIGTAVASSAGLLAPYVMGSVIESATTPLDGFNTGFFICGVIMVLGGAIAMALVNPEREAKLRSLRLQLLTASP